MAVLGIAVRPSLTVVAVSATVVDGVSSCELKFTAFLVVPENSLLYYYAPTGEYSLHLAPVLC